MSWNARGVEGGELLAALAVDDAPQRTWVDGHIGVLTEQLVVGVFDQRTETGRDAVERHVVHEGGVEGKIFIFDGDREVMTLEAEAWGGTRPFVAQLTGGEEGPVARLTTPPSGRRHDEDGGNDVKPW